MKREMDIDRSEHDFQFTRSWFLSRNLATFRQYIHPELTGKPITYLELGVFEGMSLVWMMQKVLTHPYSRAVGIDPWLITTKLDSKTMEEVMGRARHNVEPWKERCSLVRGCSAEVLRRMCKRGFAGIKRDSVDLCMIDGNHNASYVIDDARFCYRLVKPGGMILFDDVENVSEKKDHVKQGLEVYREEAVDSIEFLWKDRYMEAFRKK